MVGLVGGQMSERTAVEKAKASGKGPATVESMTSDLGPAGVEPIVLAERTLAAIREDRFWVLPPEGDSWREAARLRNQSIDNATNPMLAGLLAGDDG